VILKSLDAALAPGSIRKSTQNLDSLEDRSVTTLVVSNGELSQGLGANIGLNRPNRVVGDVLLNAVKETGVVQHRLDEVDGVEHVVPYLWLVVFIECFEKLISKLGVTDHEVDRSDQINQVGVRIHVVDDLLSKFVRGDLVLDVKHL
jgi:hypothetical protein